MGLFDASEVIAWADSQIVEADTPPIELIDVSLAAKRSNYDVLKLLREIPGSGDFVSAAHRALGLLRYRIQKVRPA